MTASCLAACVQVPVVCCCPYYCSVGIPITVCSWPIHIMTNISDLLSLINFLTNWDSLTSTLVAISYQSQLFPIQLPCFPMMWTFIVLSTKLGGLRYNIVVFIMSFIPYLLRIFITDYWLIKIFPCQKAIRYSSW